MANNFFRNIIRTRNYQQVLLGLLFVSLLPWVIFGSVRHEVMLFIAVPLAVFLGYYFLAAKRLWLMELVFIGILVAYTYTYLL